MLGIREPDNITTPSGIPRLVPYIPQHRILIRKAPKVCWIRGLGCDSPCIPDSTTVGDPKDMIF